MVSRDHHITEQLTVGIVVRVHNSQHTKLDVLFVCVCVRVCVCVTECVCVCCVLCEYVLCECECECVCVSPCVGICVYMCGCNVTFILHALIDSCGRSFTRATRS